MTITLLTAAIDSAAIPYNQDSGVGIWFFIKVMVITAVLLAITYGILVFLKRKNLLVAGPKSGSSGLTVLDTRRLGPRTTVYIVKHGKHLILITESSHHVSGVPLEMEAETGQGE